MPRPRHLTQCISDEFLVRFNENIDKAIAELQAISPMTNELQERIDRAKTYRFVSYRKKRANREYKANLNEELYYVYSTDDKGRL